MKENKIKTNLIKVNCKIMNVHFVKTGRKVFLTGKVNIYVGKSERKENKRTYVSKKKKLFFPGTRCLKL